MSKRRTKKQKQSAKHQFTVSWKPHESEAGKKSSEPGVKRQIEKLGKTKEKKLSRRIYTESSEQRLILASIKKDIGKSLILAALILASEIVIYLFWY